MTAVVQAYQFALDPTPEQEAMLRSHCGAQRYAFNWGLARVMANLGQREAEKSYGLTADDLTPALSWSGWSLRNDWNQAKAGVAPWWAENSKEAYAGGLANLAAGLANWKDSRSGKRKGPTVRFPRFKGKRAGLSCRFTTGAFGLVGAGRRHVRLPRIGVIRTHESTRKLARRLDAGTARICSAVVSFRRGRWLVSFSAQVTRQDPAAVRPTGVVGVDLGIKSLAVLSTGEVVPNPRHLEAAQRELRRLQRQASRRRGPDKRTKAVPSARWRKTQARIARLHTAVANARRDGLHKLSARLTSVYGTVVVEDLNVAGMLGNRTLARHLAGASFGEIRHQLDYKTRWHGGTLVIAGRWYPSSKTCSRCQAVKTKLPLSTRVFTCEHCGLVIDRDRNAARNLASLAETRTPGPGAAGPTPPGGNARGADQKTKPRLAGGDETGTVHAPNPRDGKTRTVARKGRLTEVH
jgi:putative transposase